MGGATCMVCGPTRDVFEQSSGRWSLLFSPGPCGILVQLWLMNLMPALIKWFVRLTSFIFGPKFRTGTFRFFSKAMTLGVIIPVGQHSGFLNLHSPLPRTFLKLYKLSFDEFLLFKTAVCRSPGTRTAIFAVSIWYVLRVGLKFFTSFWNGLEFWVSVFRSFLAIKFGTKFTLVQFWDLWILRTVVHQNFTSFIPGHTLHTYKVYTILHAKQKPSLHITICLSSIHALCE